MANQVELNSRGAELAAIGDYFGAKAHYAAALGVDPGFLPAFANLATVLGREWDKEKKETAVAMFNRLTALAPMDGNQWNNLGTLLMQLERYYESEKAITRATEIAPDLPAVWHNLALLQLRIKRPLLALESLDKVAALGHTSAIIENDRAHAELALGNLDHALELYENRWSSLVHLPPWDYHIPEWQGELLKGRRILFHGEQGFGDTIMTSRFWADLHAVGAKVTVAVPPALFRLFDLQADRQFEVVDVLHLPDDAAKRWDLHSPMYSAMRHLRLQPSDIKSSPFLLFPEVPSKRFADPKAFNIGICWASGSRGGEMDWRRRQTALKLWLPLASIPEVRLHSLQKGCEEDEIERLGAGVLVENWVSKISDFADTAAYMRNLDLVISVDTAVAHLAGALGVPVFMISQYSNCWRWWNIEKCSGLPWYESMSIIPALKPNDWEDQLEIARDWVRRAIEERAK